MRRFLVAIFGMAAGLGATLAESISRGSEAGLPFFDVFDPRDYQGHTQVWSAVQDAAGLVYFGNFGRVLVYDGARWDRIEVPGTTFVRGLAIDDQDRLWIGGVNELGFAATDTGGKRTFVSLRDKLPAGAREFGEIWRVLLTPHGVLFQSNSWLLRWDGTGFATLGLPAGSGWQVARAGGIILVSQKLAGWSTLSDDGKNLGLVPLDRPAAYDNDALLFALSGGKAGEYTLGTVRHGLIRWDGQSFAPFPTEVDETLKQKRLYRGALLPDGRMALTTLQGGGLLLDAQGRLLARLDEDAGFPDNGAINVLAAQGDELWFCLQRGLARVDARSWLTWFGTARGAPRSTLSPPQRYHGELYVTSDNGMHRLVPAVAGKPAGFVQVEGFTDAFNGISVTGDSLFGYGLQSLFEWQGGERILLPGPVSNAFGFEPMRAQPGRWMAQMDGGLYTYRKEGAAWKFEGLIPGFENVRSLVEQDGGIWWMGTPSDGLLRVTFPSPTPEGPGPPKITRYTAGAGLPAGHGWTRVSLHGDQPLLRCEKGFFRLDPVTQTFRPTNEYGAQFTDGTATARSLQEVPRDGLWIASRPAGQSELVTDIKLGVQGAKGWQSLHLPELVRLDDVSGMNYDEATDTLWVGGHAGVIRLDLAAWRAAPSPPLPAVVLRGITNSSGDALPVAGGWRLPYAHRSLQVRFAAPALGSDPAARYESTLLGDGEPIVLTDATPQREFPALSSGSYTLRFRARTGEGSWSNPVDVSFSILPPWWRSGWAWAGYCLAGAAFVGVFARFRTRALRRKAAELEATIVARTEDLRRSNIELARLNKLELDEKIAAKLAEEKARLELLRYQLNPHFLLNAFTTLRGLVFSRPEAAGDMVSRLAEFCRFALTRTDQTGGTVADEVRLIETYLATEKSRWRDELVCSVETDPAIAGVRLPPFLLQPLVENAVKYGGRTSLDKLEVRVRLTGDGAAGLRLEVANTGAWVEAGSDHHAPGSTGLGLENLRQRLRRYYPDAHQIEILPEPGWVRIVLHLLQPARDPFATTHPAH